MGATLATNEFCIEHGRETGLCTSPTGFSEVGIENGNMICLED